MTAKPQVGWSKEIPMTQQKAGYPARGYGQATTEGAKDRLRDMADATGERMKETVDSAQEMAGNIADQARHHGERAQEAVKQFRPFLEKAIKEQPLTTLAVAAGIGLVLGALWKR
jgi:ElaB/YqjD/DUF883 family membrane-anchored ribosome-binding protein